MTNVEVTTGFATAFDGTPIYYEVRGEGEPIVFVYGIACLINHWNHQIRHFSSQNKVITYDLRGHHKTEAPKNLDYLSLESLGKDFATLLDTMNIEKAHFVGHSFGAQVILKGYELNPNLFKSITFINGFAKNPIKGMFGMDIVEPLFHKFKAHYNSSPELWNILWKSAVTNPLAVHLSALAGGFNLKLTALKDIEIYARGVASMDLNVFISLFDELMMYDGEKTLETINVPTLVISGENDLVTPKKYQYLMRDKIPGCEFLSVPYGSHCTQLDFPDYINLKIEKFFEEIK